MKIILEFSARDTLASKAIQWRTGCWASHVEFALPNGARLGSRYPHGVRLYDLLPDATRLERRSVDGPEGFIDAALKEIGKPYDRSAILGFAFNRDWQEDDSWYCSEYVEHVLRAGGIRTVLTDAVRNIWPRDQLYSGILRAEV